MPYCKILAKSAQFLVVVEKLSRPFWKNFVKKIFFFLLHSYLNGSQINGVAWLGRNFDDYPDFQQKARGV